MHGGGCTERLLNQPISAAHRPAMTPQTPSGEADLSHYNLIHNPLSAVLDELFNDSDGIPSLGLIEGALVLDGDGRTLAISGRYLPRNLWEIAALSAALAGVAQQGRLHLRASPLADIMVLYGDKQLYVCRVGETSRGTPILLSIIADIRTNIGLVRIRMQQAARRLLNLVENDSSVQRLLQLHEEELEQAIHTLNMTFMGGNGQ